MDQRPIVVFLDLKRLSAKNVHTELVQVFGPYAIACSTMTKNIRNDVILQNEPEPEAEDRAEDQGFSIEDNAIWEALEIMLFDSIRQIVKMTFMLPPTVFPAWRNCFTSSGNDCARFLADFQSSEQAQVIMSKELLKLFESHELSQSRSFPGKKSH
jgi:hypothetical protein